MSSHTERGFTLVELVVVSLLLALMASLVYGALSGISRTKFALESEREITRTAQYVLGRITRELSNIREEPLTPPDDGAEEEDEFEAYLLGADGQIGGLPADSMRFVSSGTGQVLFGGLQNSGSVDITYQLVQRGQNELALVRIEQPAGDADKEQRKKQRIVFPLAENVTALNFRYRRRGKWLSEWTLRQSGIPDAVEITLQVRGDADRVETFRTAVSLHFERLEPDDEEEGGEEQ